MELDAVTTFEQAWRDAYGTPEAWERERHGTAEQAQSEIYGTPQSWQRRQQARLRFGAGRGSDTEGAAARNSRPTTPRRSAGDIFERELADTLEAGRLKRQRRTGA